MKQLIMMGVILLALCACGKGDIRVLELDGGRYTIQIKDQFGDWEWVGNDGFTTEDIAWIRSRNGMLVFSNEKSACAYRENLVALTHINRVVKCEKKGGETK